MNRIATRILLQKLASEAPAEAQAFVDKEISACQSAYSPIEVSNDLLSTIITEDGKEVSLNEMMSDSPNMINRDNEKQERFVPSPYKIVAKAYQDYLTKLVDTESVFGEAFKTSSEAVMKDSDNDKEKEKIKIYTKGLTEINKLVYDITAEIMEKFQEINTLGFSLYGNKGFNHAGKQGTTFIGRLKVLNMELKNYKNISYRNYKDSPVGKILQYMWNSVLSGDNLKVIITKPMEPKEDVDPGLKSSVTNLDSQTNTRYDSQNTAFAGIKTKALQKIAWDDDNEYGTYEQEDDLYQMNKNEADDYRHECDDECSEEETEIRKILWSLEQTVIEAEEKDEDTSKIYKMYNDHKIQWGSGKWEEAFKIDDVEMDFDEVIEYLLESDIDY